MRKNSGFVSNYSFSNPVGILFIHFTLRANRPDDS